jgi:hypothetical protein
MITNTGKNILAKYLVGQAPAYASYIAIGCGSRPVSDIYFDLSSVSATTTVATVTAIDHDFIVGDYIFINSSLSDINGKKQITAIAGDNISFVRSGLAITETLITGQISFDFSNKENLDFEMFRVPITSRGYVTENGISKIVLTAELPTEERYEITEIGIWSAGSNPTAGSNDSKTIYSFNLNENWEYHNETAAVSIPTYYVPLDNDDNIINKTDLVFYTNADNKIFTNQERVNRYERCRFLNNILVIRGDIANLSVTSNHLVVPNNSKHVHLTGADLDFNKNAPTDDLRLAFSVINKDGESLIQPDEVRILLEFAESDVHGTGQWARFETIIKDTDTDIDFATNRYFVSIEKFENLYKSSGFTWNVVDVVKFYVSIIKDGVVSDDYYVCIDALRLENTTSTNPLYGMSGYSLIKNSNTIVKAPNTTNHVEFRFGMDVL